MTDQEIVDYLRGKHLTGGGGGGDGRIERQRLNAAADRIEAQAAEVARLRADNERMQAALHRPSPQVEKLLEALTPSADTKAAYIGEFSMPFPVLDENGDERMMRPNIPWTTIKEIMAAIRARAAMDSEAQ